MRAFGRQDDFDRTLHSAFGEPPRALVDRLSGLVPSRRSPGRAALAFAVAFSAVALAALAAVGGVGYAASTIADVAHQVAHPGSLFGTRMALAPAQRSAAADEYTQSDSASNQTLPPADQTPPPGETTTFTAGGSAGVPSVAVDVPSEALSQIVTQASTGAGDLPAQIHIDPAPPAAAAGAVASVGIVVTDTTGKVVKVQLQSTAKPVDIQLSAKWSAGNPTIPCIDSGDGKCVATPFAGNGTASAPTAGTAVTVCSQLGDTATDQDGWYIDADSAYHILTCHLTLFAVVNKTDLKVSQTGRTLAPANSGKFGDAALYSTEKAQLKQIGGAKASTLKTGGTAVNFKFFVDQQVSAYVQLYKGGVKVPIALKGTMIRGTTLTKSKNVPTLHVSVLSPGTLGVRLHAGRPLQHGASYRIRIAVLNFDGSSTVAFIPFKG
jgi:hypothetical protein